MSLLSLFLASSLPRSTTTSAPSIYSRRQQLTTAVFHTLTKTTAKSHIQITTRLTSTSTANSTANMATAYQIRVPAHDTGLLKFDQTDETASKMSALLQKDLETHHVFFNQKGFHDHIVHHLLSLFGTGATFAAIQAGYDTNATYQLPVNPTHPAVADSLASDWASEAPKHLGRGTSYPDFLLFFQRRLDAAGGQDGIRSVLSEFLFNRGDPRADDLLQRMLAGFVHPLIQLMFGVEWSQPAIVAEALAQAAVHANKLKGFLEGAEDAAANDAATMPSMKELYEDVFNDPRFKGVAQIKDPNSIHDRVLARAPDAMLEYAAKIRVREDDVDEKTAEMFESAVWAAAGAALRPGKQAKWDFFMIHHVNSAPIFVTLNKLPWISTADKARILEWKMRIDLVQYAARALPPIRFDDVESYRPEDLDKGVELVEKSQDLLPRFHAVLDDGHAIKLVRALDICRDIVRPYEGKAWHLIKNDETWLKLHYMVLDGTEHPPRWIWSAGFDELWEDVPDRK